MASPACRSTVVSRGPGLPSDVGLNPNSRLLYASLPLTLGWGCWHLSPGLLPARFTAMCGKRLPWTRYTAETEWEPPSSLWSPWLTVLMAAGGSCWAADRAKHRGCNLWAANHECGPLSPRRARADFGMKCRLLS